MHIIATYCIFLLIGCIWCLEVVPKWGKITYINKEYLDSAMASISRYGNKYYIDLSGTIKHTWGNNITVDIIATEYVRNTYRRSFIGLKYELCDFIRKDRFFGPMFRIKGPSCPLPKGTYEIRNMTIKTRGFPEVFPYKKGGADIELSITDTGELVAAGELRAKFLQEA